MKAENETPGGRLFDHLLSKFDLKNDAALARRLSFAPPVISKVRHGTLEVSPNTILVIHETLGVPVKEIRQVMAMPA